MSLTYTSYLKLPQLLDLQEVRSDPEEHDELLFIVIHQVYELWFKLLLHELDKAGRTLAAGDLWASLDVFKRCRTIMKTLVAQLDILETMTPMSFGSFRERLETSSGFQSTQFREFEFALGYKRSNVMKYYAPGAPGVEAIDARSAAPSIIDHFYRFLAHQGAAVPQAVLDRDVSLANEPDETVQQELLRLYRERPDVCCLLETMTDFDEGIQEWRYRHVKVVERTIGAKKGTGGSPGVDFLKQSLFMPVFADLWAIRHAL
ncbi:MAG: tryptophan 2,3-dioxygenase [Planctomycetota bacterium]|jgi:tryptophan 2,3-dioxygenase